MESETLVNRVSQSGLISIDLEELYALGERHLLDIAPGLFRGMIVKEAEFRDWVKNLDVEALRDKHVALTCSADAIIPTWAWMLITTRLQGVVASYVLGDLADLEQALFQKAIDQLDLSGWTDGKFVIKGCSDKPVPPYAYTALMNRLLPIASSIMYGEPCSTVPVYKRKKQGA